MFDVSDPPSRYGAASDETCPSIPIAFPKTVNWTLNARGDCRPGAGLFLPPPADRHWKTAAVAWRQVSATAFGQIQPWANVRWP